MSLPAFLLLTDTAENRTLCRARALNKRGAFVASGRGRRQAAEAGAYLRSKYADSPRKASTRYGCDVIESQPAMRRINGSPPAPRRIELCAGRGRKENAAATQGGMRFPDGSPGGKRVPESALRLGCSFRMMPQAETATRNRAVEWDMLSQWQLKRKVHPGILVRNGMQFPNEWLAESSSRNPRSERDVLSQRRSKRKVHPGIPPQTGTHFPLHLPPGKTCALAIPKLGRRRPKRNRRRSI